MTTETTESGWTFNKWDYPGTSAGIVLGLKKEELLFSFNEGGQRNGSLPIITFCWDKNLFIYFLFKGMRLIYATYKPLNGSANPIFSGKLLDGYLTVERA